MIRITHRFRGMVFPILEEVKIYARESLIKRLSCDSSEENFKKVEWDGRNQAGVAVATGVYNYITNDKKGKIAVVKK